MTNKLIFILLNGGAHTDAYIDYKESEPFTMSDFFNILLILVVVYVVLVIIKLSSDKKKK